MDVARKGKVKFECLALLKLLFCHKHSLTLGFENILSQIFFYDRIYCGAIKLIPGGTEV